MSTSTQDLEKKHKALMNRVRLPDSVLQKSVPRSFRHFDLQFARELLSPYHPWGSDDSFDEQDRLIRGLLAASADGRQLVLASEISLLESLIETGRELDHEGPFGIREFVCPVVVQGHIVHLIRSGKYRLEAFTDKDLNDIAFLAGKPLAEIREAATNVPVHSGQAREKVADLCRMSRDTLAALFSEHIRCRELSMQQLQSERLNALGTLAEGMAHHFSNLLSVILGYSSMILDRGEWQNDTEDALRKVTEAAQRGRRFTEEVLSVSGSIGEEDATPASVHERIKGVLTLLESRIGKDTTVDLQLEAENDQVLAPQGILHQIAFNVVANAVDSMTGGGSVTISTRNVKREQLMLRILVHDAARGGKTGTGMPIEESLQTAADDVGPNVAALLGMVAQLDGTVRISNESGMEGTLEVTLPAFTGDRDQVKPRKVRRRLAPSRIWVVDDDPVVREMSRRVLTEDGHAVKEVGSGEELQSMWSKAREEDRPELILFDFNLPDLSGLAAVTWLREEEKVKTPIILVSGFTEEHPQIRKALKNRKTFLLPKPFSFRDMADQVTVALGETLIGE